MIANATRTVAETEEVGLEITQELSRNREKIESSRARVRLKNICFQTPPISFLRLRSFQASLTLLVVC